MLCCAKYVTRVLYESLSLRMFSIVASYFVLRITVETGSHLSGLNSSYLVYNISKSDPGSALDMCINSRIWSRSKYNLSMLNSDDGSISLDLIFERIKLFSAWITRSHTSKVLSSYNYFHIKFKYYFSVITHQGSINTT